MNQRELLHTTQYLDLYQRYTQTTAVYPRETQEEALVYTILGASSEVGELSSYLKKLLRGDYGDKITPELKEKMVAELGDVLWYVARIADELVVNLSDVATANVTKLERRKENGTIKGDGDNR